MKMPPHRIKGAIYAREGTDTQAELGSARDGAERSRFVRFVPTGEGTIEREGRSGGGTGRLTLQCCG